MVLPMTLQISGTSARVAQEITQISDQVGTVHEAMETIAKPIGLTDPASAKPLVVTKGAIRFDAVSFHYGRKGGIIEPSGRIQRNRASYPITTFVRISIFGW